MPGFIYPPYLAMHKAILIAIYIYIVLPAVIYGSQSTTENSVDGLLQSFNVPNFIQQFDLCKYEKELLQQSKSDLSKQMVLYQQQEQELDQCDQELNHLENKFKKCDGKLDECDGKLNYLDNKFKKCDRKLDHLDNNFKKCDGKLDECDGKKGECDGKLDDCEAKLPTGLLCNIELERKNPEYEYDFWTIGTKLPEFPRSCVLQHIHTQPLALATAIAWIKLPTPQTWLGYTITVTIETESITGVFGLYFDDPAGFKSAQISKLGPLALTIFDQAVPQTQNAQSITASLSNQIILTVTVSGSGAHSVRANGQFGSPTIPSGTWFTSINVNRVGFGSFTGSSVVVSNLEIVHV